MKNNNKFLFETSWEVCNKVGGIHTVIISKIKEAKKEFGDNYILIGPLLDKNTGFVEESGPEIANIKHKLEINGIKARVGRWDVKEKPLVVLLSFQGVFDKDNLLYQLWEDFGVDSMAGGWDYIEPVLFGAVAGKTVELISEFYDGYEIQAHFHEWMTGSGLLYLNKYLPQVSTIFTTHATILGRSIAGNGLDLYNLLEKVNPDQEASRLNVFPKYSMEKTVAREADAFTTVSEITAFEAENLLNVKVDHVLTNGFNVKQIPSYKQNKKQVEHYRTQLLEFASRFLGKEFKYDDTFIISTSGRYEFRNKGLDVLTDALGKMKRTSALPAGKKLLSFYFVLARMEELKEVDTPKEYYHKYSDISTHQLWNPSNDPLVNRCRENQLLNAADDNIHVIFVPVYLNGTDGVLNLPYYEAISGCDLTIFPSYYEPWGYTPMESVAYSVPTVTTDLAGFGKWLRSMKFDSEGVVVMDRLNKTYEETVDEMLEVLTRMVSIDPGVYSKIKEEVYEIATQAEWEHFYKHYLDAYKSAVKNKDDRIMGYQQDKSEQEETLNFRGNDSIRPRMRSMTVKSALPDDIAKLREMAYNIWWSWNHDAYQLFNGLDPVLYDKIGNNPVSLLESIENQKLKEITNSESYMTLYEDIVSRYNKYLKETKSLLKTKDTIGAKNPVAYFSMEFGFHESLPVYSGGLGILSGDHIKSASDLNINLIGVGLLYRKGYFKQVITKNGEQHAEDFVNDFYRMPVQEVMKNNKAVEVTVDLPGRKVSAKVWKVQVGRIPVYLLDTDLLKNNPSDREITGRLYGGGKKVRIEQEIVLGIGGVRMLQELNISPSVYHLNEGHSAFLIIQRIINQMKYNQLDYHSAVEVIKASTVFTTHTPVPAGNEVFDIKMVENYLRYYVESNGMSWQQLNELADRDMSSDSKYEMTKLALKNSIRRNGVSKLHGIVSRNMWSHIWQGYLTEEIPIGHITNGIHVGSWLHTEMKNLFAKYSIFDLNRNLLKKDYWKRVNNIPDWDLWQTHINLKSRLFSFLKEKITVSWTREGEDPTILDRFLHQLTPAPLTIGFARRFATYKRATLLFSDFERFKRIVLNSKYPVQFIFAGKAHPDDVEGQRLITEIVKISKQEEFLGKIVFLEDYDIKLARKLVSSVDVWLNNPMRPHEASGTSGMKTGVNGVLNCSILDGWWDEGYDGTNGWVIGDRKQYVNTETQNIFDSDSFYDVLENEIIPMYYARNSKGIPEKWVEMMKNSISSIIAEYNTNRMVEEYMFQMYLPASAKFKKLIANNFKLTRQISEWKQSVRNRFSSIHIENLKIKGSSGDNLNVDDEIKVMLEISPGKVAKEEIKAQLILISDHTRDGINTSESQQISYDQIRYLDMEWKEEKGGLFYYECVYKAEKAGKFNYGIRVIPFHEEVDDIFDMNLVYWA